MNAVIQEFDCETADCEDAADAGRRVLHVTLESLDGQRWSAIGGGDTVEEALRFALGSAPGGVHWHVAGWNDLYGV